MMNTYTLTEIPEIEQGGALLQGSEVRIALDETPQRYLAHGWQSWSTTAWVTVERPLPPPRPRLLRPLQSDPVYADEGGHHGSYLGAVELEDGRVVFLGALGTESHVWLREKRLIGRCEDDAGEWFVAQGNEMQILARYAELLGERFGRGRSVWSPRVWCSWYSYYTHIGEERLLRTLDDLGDLPFDVFQVDDGWQREIGDWEANEKFPSGMAELASRIRETGRRPGLWLAPFLVSPSSILARRRPEWLLRDGRGKPVLAGFNWGRVLCALDVTCPGVLNWLRALMQKVRNWGYEYVKLDFLYAGALPGARHTPIPRERAFRLGLQTMREALGDAFLLACGAPILPSIGLCDALRVGPDVAPHWANPRDDILLGNLAIPGTRNAIRTTLHRLWLQPLVQVDPDVVYFRSRGLTMTESQKRQLQDLALICGYKATSDPPSWMSESEREALRAFLSTEPAIERTGRYTFRVDGREVDFSTTAALPPPPTASQRVAGAILGWVANSRLVLQANAWLTEREHKKQVGG